MDSTRSMQELTAAFEQALVAVGYSESRLSSFRIIIKRLLTFGADLGIKYYSSNVGKQFLEKFYPVEFDGRRVHELPYTTQYAWRTIALLDDFNTHGAFFRPRRLNRTPQFTPEFQELSDKFGDDCRSYVSEDYSRNMPAKRSLRKNPLPSVWEREDVDKLLSAVDRGNPMGKRDYAILLLVIKLGLRVGDIRTLCLADIDWENSRLSFTQSKTQKRVDLPLPNDVGWAIIDYLKYGRPKTDIQNIFLTGRTPITALSDTSSLSSIIIRYAQMAKIDLSKRKHGMHSLRHTLATRLMEENIPISTIANILGHSSTDTVKKYLQVDISHLRDCALDVEV